MKKVTTFKNVTIFELSAVADLYKKIIKSTPSSQFTFTSELGMPITAIYEGKTLAGFASAAIDSLGKPEIKCFFANAQSDLEIENELKEIASQSFIRTFGIQSNVPVRLHYAVERLVYWLNL